MFFDDVAALPADPLLGISALYAADQNPKKVDLGVGVYRDETGTTPIFASVKSAETQFLQQQSSKSYIPPAGYPGFIAGMDQLLYGSHGVLQDKRVATVTTPGGCGALRLAAEFIKRRRPDATVWLSDPTWANHEPLLGDAGLKLAKYPYYNLAESSVMFDEMLDALRKISANDVVLLHACCHNPSGADLTEAQWQEVAEVAQQQGFLVFIDIAYQGFGRDLDADAYGVRLMAEKLPELVVASSCSKNFGLYRERTGALSIVASSTNSAAAIVTHLNKIARGIYSMPPSHGAGIVETLLNDDALRRQWYGELAAVRERITGLRNQLAAAVNQRLGSERFAYIEKESGMFSFLGITPEQVTALREQYSIYMAGSSRINVAGLLPKDIDYVAESLVQVIA